jgi:hypothetical protein
MEAISVETERFSLSEGVDVSGAQLKRAGPLGMLLRFLSFSVSGETRTTREEGSLDVDLFGTRLHLLVLPGHTYLYGGVKLAHHDHGRPWVDLGARGLETLLPGGSRKPRPKPGPTSVPQPFKQLAATLRSPISVTTLGGGTIDGEAVIGFREQVDLRALGVPSSSISPLSSERAFGASSPSRVSPEVATVEAFIAPSGLPVRTRIVIARGRAAAVVAADVPAINFPLAVAAPPAGQTIALKRLRRLEHGVTPRRRVLARHVTG